MDLTDLVVEKTQSGNHWHSVEHGTHYDMYFPTPPLELFVKNTEMVLLLHLTGASEADVESLFVKFRQNDSPAYQDDYRFSWNAVVDASRALSADPRLETIEPFSNSLRFYGDLRLFLHNRSAYFAGPNGLLGIPLESFADSNGVQDNLTDEIIQRTGSTYVRIALPWLLERCTRKGKVPARDSSYAYDVFVSHKSEDFKLAKEVYDHLIPGKRVFLSEESLPAMGNADYTKMIDEALGSAKHLVLVGSSIENISSSWVEAEWRMFIMEKRSGRKTGNVITVFTDELSYDRLPISLRFYEAIPYGPSSFETIAQYVA